MGRGLIISGTRAMALERWERYEDLGYMPFSIFETHDGRFAFWVR